MQRLAGTVWSDVTLRRTRGQADPDATPRAVALPAAWEDGAADALAALMPGAGPGTRPLSLVSLAEAWIRRAAAGAAALGLPEAGSLAEALRVPPSAITLLAGAASREKTFRIQGEAEGLAAVLEQWA